MSAKTIRFVGNFDVNGEGKFLWEILAQLRQFGVGRMVTKAEWGRKWPEQPSYLRVQRVAPTMDRWLFGGRLWAEWVYRGRNLGVYEFAHDLNRSDWRLIHRHEEESFAKCSQPMQEIKLPDSFPLPPLQVLMAKRAAAKVGREWDPARERAPLELCIDPEFAHIKHLIKQAPPTDLKKSIYDEVDRAALLDLYGKELPTKVEAWNVGPAGYTPHFAATDMGGPTTRRPQN